LVLSISLTGVDFAEQPIHGLERQDAKVMTSDLLATLCGLNNRVNLLVEVREESRAKTPFLQIFRAEGGKRFGQSQCYTLIKGVLGGYLFFRCGHTDHKGGRVNGA
jgi:hypothetical protein